MGIKKNRKNRSLVTFKKLEDCILCFLTEHEADLASDYKPESEQWRQQLAKALALKIHASCLQNLYEKVKNKKKS